MEEAKLDHTVIPDNSMTVILKNNGKVYQKGIQLIGIDDTINDEDLESELQAVDTMALVMRNTILYTLAGRELPTTTLNSEGTTEDEEAIEPEA